MHSVMLPITLQFENAKIWLPAQLLPLQIRTRIVGSIDARLYLSHDMRSP